MGKVLYLKNSSRTNIPNNDPKIGRKFNLFRLLMKLVVRLFFFVLAILWWFVTLTIIVWWFLLGAFLILDIISIGVLIFSDYNFDIMDRMIHLVLPLLGITAAIFGILQFQLTCHPKRFSK